MLATMPPPSFHFAVSFDGSSVDSSFQEVSGLKAQWTTEDVAEGGQNRFVHRLPLRTSYTNAVLKRGVVVGGSPLAGWLAQSFRADFAVQPVVTRSVVILLLDGGGKPLVKWWLAGAYPVSWDHSPLSSTENNLLIETIELSYAFFERTIVGEGSHAA